MLTPVLHIGQIGGKPKTMVAYGIDMKLGGLVKLLEPLYVVEGVRDVNYGILKGMPNEGGGV